MAWNASIMSSSHTERTGFCRDASGANRWRHHHAPQHFSTVAIITLSKRCYCQGELSNSEMNHMDMSSRIIEGLMHRVALDWCVCVCVCVARPHHLVRTFLLELCFLDFDRPCSGPWTEWKFGEWTFWVSN